MEIKAQDIPPLSVTITNSNRVIFAGGIHSSLYDVQERTFSTFAEARAFEKELWSDDKAIREAAAQ